MRYMRVCVRDCVCMSMQLHVSKSCMLMAWLHLPLCVCHRLCYIYGNVNNHRIHVIIIIVIMCVTRPLPRPFLSPSLSLSLSLHLLCICNKLVAVAGTIIARCCYNAIRCWANWNNNYLEASKVFFLLYFWFSVFDQIVCVWLCNGQEQCVVF